MFEIASTVKKAIAGLLDHSDDYAIIFQASACAQMPMHRDEADRRLAMSLDCQAPHVT